MPTRALEKPLSNLISLALRKYGDSAGSNLYAGDTEVFIFYANDIVREINFHPYTDDDEDIEYYNHEEERRAIDNMVLVKGMLFHFSVDQNSKRAPMYRKDYYDTLNQWLYRKNIGSGPINIKKFDDENSG